MLINRCLVALFLSICIVGCTESSPESEGSSAVDTGSLSNATEQDSTAISDANKSQESVAAPDKPASSNPMGNMMAVPKPEDIVFKEDVTSNAKLPAQLDDLVFVDKDGNRVQLDSYLGSKNIVLVFTEGFSGGMLCPFCKTQTARLVNNYEKFEALDTEVIVVYPGGTEHLGEFIEAATKTEKKQVDRLPFPVVLDKELKAVGYFNIASNLAHPSTFIIDKDKNVRLAYVGADMTADRPSVAAMLRILEASRDQDETKN